MTEHLPECPVWRCCKPDERATMHMCICPDDERIGGLITRQRAEQIGRNIGQHGCVITEQRHLPECPMLEPFSADTTQHCFCTRKPCIHDEMECICSHLRACEERVREDEQSHNFSPDIHWDGMAEAYLRGIDAAREAVLGAKAIDVYYGRGSDEPPQFVWLNNAISAIDALREES